MLVPFLIMLREGMEAALVVGIIAGYLRQTGRGAWMPAVWMGVLAAVALSLFAGAALQWASAEFPQKAQELFEALVGLLAVAVLTSMVFWMRKASRSIAAELRESVAAALDGRGKGGWGLVAVVFFAVAREGLESVFFLQAVFQQSEGHAAGVGALLGLAAAVSAGWGVYAGGVRLDLRRFFRWTGVFILVVAAGILAGSVRALHEAGVWNGLQEVVFDLGRVLPADGAPGAVFAGIFGYHDRPTLGEAIAYLSYLVVALAYFLRPARGAHSVAPGARAAADPLQRPCTGQPPAPGRAMKLALAAPALLVVAGLAAFYAASRHVHERAAGDEGAVQVTILADRCEPQALTVPAGRVRFRIVNRSDRVVEWEILDGVMVVEERENIAPGFAQALSARLQPGHYDMTCGLLGNPHGTLHVAAVGGVDGAGAPTLADFVGPLAEYRVYLAMQAAALVRATRDLAQALAAGHWDQARASYESAQRSYRRMETAAGLYADLRVRIDGTAGPASGEGDANAGDFVRLEQALSAAPGAAGLDAVVHSLAEHAQALQQRLRRVSVTPGSMAGGAARLAADMAGLAADADGVPDVLPMLPALEGRFEGVRKVSLLLQPLVARTDGALAARIAGDLDGAQRAFAALGEDARMASPGGVARPGRTFLAERLKALAGDMKEVEAALTLD